MTFPSRRWRDGRSPGQLEVPGFFRTLKITLIGERLTLIVTPACNAMRSIAGRSIGKRQSVSTVNRKTNNLTNDPSSRAKLTTGQALDEQRIT